MRTVYKFILCDQPTVLRNMLAPRITHVGIDPASGEVAVWIDHHTENPTGVLYSPVDLTLTVVGTGWEVPEGAAHVGSTIQPPFVWHVYMTTTVVPMHRRTPENVETVTDRTVKATS